MGYNPKRNQHDVYSPLYDSAFILAAFNSDAINLDGFLLLAFGAMYYFNTLTLIFVFGMYSFWIPQIIMSARKDTISPFFPKFVIGMTVARGIIPICSSLTHPLKSLTNSSLSQISLVALTTRRRLSHPLLEPFY